MLLMLMGASRGRGGFTGGGSGGEGCEVVE